MHALPQDTTPEPLSPAAAAQPVSGRLCTDVPRHSSRPGLRRSGTRLALLALVAAALPGCPKKETVGYRSMNILGEGVINDPSNRSLRFDLLKFGLDQFCAEMLTRGAPLQLRDGEPVLGRFYAESCSSQVIDDPQRHSFVVQYAGKGYAWTNVTGRTGFRTMGLVEYAPDFRVENGAMYVYFRPRNIDATSFDLTLVESAVAQTAATLTGVNPEQVGRQIVAGQLGRGFTVIRYGENGETEFGLGVIPVGQRPYRPFQVISSDKLTLENDQTEVHANQQDFIGGFAVADSDQALFLTLKLDGAPAVDVLVVPQSTGAPAIESFVTRAGPTSLGAPPVFASTLLAGGPQKFSVPVQPGSYYLLVDHSSAIGTASPPAVSGDDRAAHVDYLVQLGDAP